MAHRHRVISFLVGLLTLIIGGRSYAQAVYGGQPTSYAPAPGVYSSGPYLYGTPWYGYLQAANNTLYQFNANARNSASTAAAPASTGSYVVPGIVDSSIHSYLRIAIPQHPNYPSVRVNDEEHVIYCAPGTTLSLTGDAVTNMDYLTCALEVDRRRFAIDKVCNITDKYLFYWTAGDSGDHLLRVVFTPVGGTASVTVRTLTVRVLGTPPFSLAALPNAFVDADATTPITRPAKADFKPARAELIVNDIGLPLPADQATLVIPATHMPEGDYAVSMTAYDAAGARFVSMPKTVRVIHTKGTAAEAK